jgi:hypothetical protein
MLPASRASQTRGLGRPEAVCVTEQTIIRLRYYDLKRPHPISPSLLYVVFMKNFYMGCAICGKPLRLEQAHSGDDGLPVHEECYVLGVKRAKTKQEGTTERRKSSFQLPHLINLDGRER